MGLGEAGKEIVEHELATGVFTLFTSAALLLVQPIACPFLNIGSHSFDGLHLINIGTHAWSSLKQGTP